MAEINTDKKNLFSDFEPATTEEWEGLLTRDLKGADYKEKLLWESVEGIEALPFYRREDIKKLPHVEKGSEIKTPAGWQFSEVIDKADPGEANKLAKQAVEGGAESLWLTIQITSDDVLLGGNIRGIHVQNIDDLKAMFDGIDLNKTGLVFDSGVGSAAMPGLMKAFLQSTQGKLAGSDVSFLFDPFTFIAKHGRLPLAENELNTVIRQMAAESECKTLAADGAFYHNCGATIVQELGIALAIGSEYLARVPVKQREQAANQIWMHLSAGTLYFPEIAKFRAARLLWNRVLDGYEIENRDPLIIHASTSKWNKAIADPHNNILRATTEAIAAATGGANRITIHPYNAHFEQTNSMSERIARNMSHIINEEAHLSAVENPADGSYYIEVLTDEIARKAWDFFQLIENQGGFQKALEAKIIQGEVGRSRKAKDKALATRKLVLTGVNHYPDAGQDLPDDLFHNTPVDSLQKSGKNPKINPLKLTESLTSAFRDDATIGDIVPSFFQPVKQLYSAMKTCRAAEPFERLRLRTQNFTEKRANAIKVQLVPVGSKKMRKARATFSQNFLECAGFKVDNPVGFDSVEESKAELKTNGADIFVLCGSDDKYQELVKPFCKAFGGDHTTTILAGNPKEKIEEYHNAGIDFFIYSGSNMLEILTEIQGRVIKSPPAP